MPQNMPVPEVEAAIAQVLAAEREALAAVEAARAEGGEILLQAHVEARRIAERGERRLGRLRAAVTRRVREEAERIEDEIVRLAAAPVETPADEAAVAAAVAAVAAALIGTEEQQQ